MAVISLPRLQKTVFDGKYTCTVSCCLNQQCRVDDGVISSGAKFPIALQQLGTLSEFLSRERDR